MKEIEPYNVTVLEPAMALPAIKETFDQITILPPSFNLVEAIGAVQNAHELDRSITRTDAELRRWRASAVSTMRVGIDQIDRMAKALPKVQVAGALIPLIDEALMALDESIAVVAVPVHEGPKGREVMAKIGSLSGNAGRYLRKMVDRIEDVRVAQYNGLIDMRYGMVAFRSEYDPDNTPAGTFESADDLGAFLKSHVA